MDHQVKVIRAIVEKITIYKNRVKIMVPEISVGEIQKVLNEKLAFGVGVSPEEWGVKTNFKQNNRRIGAVAVKKNWRAQQGPKADFLASFFIGETRFMPAFELPLDLFRIIGYEGERFLSVVPVGL